MEFLTNVDFGALFLNSFDLLISYEVPKSFNWELFIIFSGAAFLAVCLLKNLNPDATWWQIIRNRMITFVIVVILIFAMCSFFIPEVLLMALGIVTLTRRTLLVIRGGFREVQRRKDERDEEVAEQKLQSAVEKKEEVEKTLEDVEKNLSPLEENLKKKRDKKQRHDQKWGENE